MGVIRTLLILCCALAVNAPGQGLRSPFFTAAVLKPASGGGGGGSGGLTSTIFSETLEGTGYSTTSPAWTESLGGGTVDEDYTATVLDGSQSFRILTASDASSYAYNSFTAGSERWVYFMFRPVSTPNSSNGEIIEIWNNGQSRIADLQLTSTGTIQVRHGTATATTSGAMSDGTTYHVYFRYVSGSGANGVASVGFSTDGTRPTSGSNFASTSAGTATTDAEYIAPGWIGFSGVIDLIFDKLQVGDSTSAP
jgi:hypothetical protein